MIVKNILLKYFKNDVKLVQYDSGEDFLKACDSFEIVFMDIKLKDKNGFITSAEYKKYYPHSIIIILTKHIERKRQITRLGTICILWHTLKNAKNY